METAREQPPAEQPPLQPYIGHDYAPDPDEQYLKSIKLNIPTFDGRLDPPFFLIGFTTWTCILTYYPFFEPRKVRFTVMKLTCQATQY